MSVAELLRLGAALHGQLGWLVVALLWHPVFALRGSRPGRWATTLATVLTTLVVGGGAALYPSYRALVKQAVFQAHPSLGWAFERKEHLAVGVLTFAWVGLVAARSGDRALARLAYGLAAALATLVATIGTVTAAAAPF